MNGILVANEAVDEARRLKKEMFLFKVDFEKAYDSVDLNYLDVVMSKMNFPTLWQKWILECVGKATTSVLVNGSPTEEFLMERGLRQGDPLSLFLFLLAAEDFNVLMKSLVESDLYHGYVVGRDNGVFVSHLQFADDTLLLGDKSWANVQSIKAMFTIFKQVSGLKVNVFTSFRTYPHHSHNDLSVGVLTCLETHFSSAVKDHRPPQRSIKHNRILFIIFIGNVIFFGY